ncbi:hypothetical protein AAHE18_16G207200 [Arachis hypogaea]|nr:uncharacterized protein DS421_16g553660 [Arachis hypogaea]
MTHLSLLITYWPKLLITCWPKFNKINCPRLFLKKNPNSKIQILTISITLTLTLIILSWIHRPRPLLCLHIWFALSFVSIGSCLSSPLPTPLVRPSLRLEFVSLILLSIFASGSLSLPSRLTLVFPSTSASDSLPLSSLPGSPSPLPRLALVLPSASGFDSPSYTLFHFASCYVSSLSSLCSLFLLSSLFIFLKIKNTCCYCA